VKLLNLIKIWFLSWAHRFKYKAYNSIDFLPTWNFYQIKKENDLRYLVKGIDYECLPIIYLNLNTQWMKISEEFANYANPQLMSDLKFGVIGIEAKRNEFLYLKGAVEVLSNKDFLSPVRLREIINRIKNLGYRFDDSTETGYYNSIIDLQRQMIGLSQIIKLKNGEFDQKFRKVEAQPQELEEIMTLLSKHFGMIMSSKILTCKQFLSYLKTYNKEVEKQPVKQ
jgi:hypothetical protein